jgi:hypothetical protein
MEMRHDNDPEKEKPAIPEPTGMENWGENLMVPTFEEKAFEKFRAPEVSTDLVKDLHANPEKFGTAKIKAAIEFLRPEFRDFGGMIQIRESYLTETDPGKKYETIYSVRSSTSFYDSKVINGVWLSEKAFHLPGNGSLTPELLEEFLARKNSRYPEAMVAIKAGEEISIDRKVFDRYVAALSRPNCYEFSSNTALSYASMAERLTWKWGIVYQTNREDYATHLTHKISTSPLVIDCYASDKGNPGYVAEVKRASWGGPVLVKNIGPAQMTLRFTLPVE